tara:strand:- start:1208 stop:1411 length:204 start_codon:yes stop_codon:yes gene_type:complete
MVAQRRQPRPGQRQRLRLVVALGLAFVVWGLRWLWPLQWLPGWVVLLVVLWALLELAALLLVPQRWN